MWPYSSASSYSRSSTSPGSEPLGGEKGPDVDPRSPYDPRPQTARPVGTVRRVLADDGEEEVWVLADRRKGQKEAKVEADEEATIRPGRLRVTGRGTLEVWRKTSEWTEEELDASIAKFEEVVERDEAELDGARDDAVAMGMDEADADGHAMNARHAIKTHKTRIVHLKQMRGVLKDGR